MNKMYIKTICVALIKYQDKVYKVISWSNEIAHNYIYLFKLNLSSSLKGLELLVKVRMVAVWHTLSNWKEITIAYISYYMCLNMTNKKSE